MKEIKILEEKKNTLFNRKEITGTIMSETTPSRSQILELFAKKFSVPAEAIKVKGIHGKFGSKTFTIEANLYSSKEDKEGIELKKKKDAEIEKPKAAETKPEEKTEEVAKDNVNVKSTEDKSDKAK